MTITRYVAIGIALLIVGGCTDRRTILEPAAPEHTSQRQSSDLSASAARQVQASGHFDALVDFTTLTLTPRGQNCRLVVKGQLVFTGTMEGTATGQTSALVFAPCSQVAAAPPGTYPDVFRSELNFEGTVAGQPARASGFYLGHSEPGGHIDARLVFFGDVTGTLDVDAQLAVGGEYSGKVVVR